MAKPVSTADHSLVIFLFLKVKHTSIYQCLNNIEIDLHRKQYLSDFLFFINNPHFNKTLTVTERAMKRGTYRQISKIH